MDTLLTDAQQRALADASGIPARVPDSTTNQILVILRSDDFDWVRGLLGDEPDAPRRLDAQTQQSYALVPESRYERFKAFFEDDPLSPAERAALLREAGKRAGWDDPAWEADGGLDPQGAA